MIPIVSREAVATEATPIGDEVFVQVTLSSLFEGLWAALDPACSTCGAVGTERCRTAAGRPARRSHRGHV